MNKVRFLLTVLFFIPFTLLAQNRVVKGKVLDDAGKPLQGANITGQGAKKGVQTDNDGNFSITISGTRSVNLVISSVGFESKVVTVAGDDAGTVQLTRAVITQEDVVVIGYSSIKRKDLTGSVSSVGSKDLKDFPLSSAA
ncbi:MAG TPA: carboxypeptidase-like regulatory domain-containing protein, partial [Ferruginibacter sp.]|nr:carboxypeptidase-like regulatory domain-containing protein [Ferruginibacter sp.]